MLALILASVISIRCSNIVDMVFLKLLIAGMSFFGIYGLILLLTKENFINSYVLEGILKNKVFIGKEVRNEKYDYLIVGSGLYGAVFAQQAQKKGRKS